MSKRSEAAKLKARIKAQPPATGSMRPRSSAPTIQTEVLKVQTQSRKNVRCPSCKSGNVHNKGRLGSTIYYRCNSCFVGDDRMGVSTTFQAFFDRDLSTAFEPGEWAGLVPVIVGPHPRAMDYDLRQLRDRPSIVVGAAWLLFAKYSKIPDILYSSYEKFINRSRDNEEFQTWTNYKVCPSFLARSVPNDWLTVEGSKEFFSEDGGLKEGVSTMHDCFTAVCIGAALGAREFDLVGFQLDGNSIGLGFSPQAQKDDHLAILGLNTLAQKYGLKFNNLR